MTRKDVGVPNLLLPFGLKTRSFPDATPATPQPSPSPVTALFGLVTATAGDGREITKLACPACPRKFFSPALAEIHWDHDYRSAA